jgi:hypothetical protein
VYESLGDDDPDSLLDAANVMVEQIHQDNQFPTYLESVVGSLYSEVRHMVVIPYRRDCG